MEDDNLKWLLDWYHEQCDGSWEHENGIKIGTLDNPGWFLKINLSDTDLKDKKFQEINIERSEQDWIHCAIKEELFEGFGGPFNLLEILKIFREWSEN